MTSQRYLNDRTDFRDFLRSLKKALPYPLIALLVLCFAYLKPTLTYINRVKKTPETYEWFKNTKIISMFGIEDYKNLYEGFTEVVAVGMVLCGIVTALALFSFAFKKNSVNVYFSMGITRARMFINRISAAAIELFIASFIPFLLTFIVNAVSFGFNIHQVNLMLYFTFAMFVSGLAGLAIGAFAASVSGSSAEMIITSLASSSLAMVLFDIFGSLKSLLLKGYVYSESSLERILGSISSPWNFVSNMSVDASSTQYYQSPMTYMATLITGDKLPKELKITMGFITPLIIWTVISIVIFAVGLFLFKLRKNENAHSFGKFAISSGINGLAVLLFGANALSSVCITLYQKKLHHINMFVCALIFLVGTALIFFLAELIISRKLKRSLKMFTIYGGTVLVIAVFAIVMGTGYFGTYNKLPDVKDIEFVSMSYNDPLGIFTYNAVQSYKYNGVDASDPICKSSNEDDIKLCCDYFEKAKNEKANGNEAVRSIEFVIKTKDGKTIVREFNVYSSELSYNYDKDVFNSNYFDSILKSVLVNKTVNSENSYDAYYYGINTIFDNFYVLDGTMTCDAVTDYSNYGYYYDADEESATGATEISQITDNVTGSSPVCYYADEELMLALYNDLSKLTYDQYYGNKSQPVYTMALYLTDAVCEQDRYYTSFGYLELNYSETHYTSVGEYVIIVYPEMEETIAVLEEYEVAPMTKGVKSVIIPESKLELRSIFAKKASQTGWASYDLFGPIGNVFYSGDVGIGWGWVSSDAMFDTYPQGNGVELYERLYESEGVKTVRISNKEKAGEIADASYSVYNTYGDNGRFIFVIYEDGSIVGKYLPESALSVLS